jgi:hypothetical protein
VAFIGALTSIPLTLLLLAVYRRKILRVSILLPTKGTVVSYSLLVFATIFMIAGLIGSEGQEKTAEERYQKWFAGITFQTRPVGVEAGVLQQFTFEGVPLQDQPDPMNPATNTCTPSIEGVHDGVVAYGNEQGSKEKEEHRRER